MSLRRVGKMGLTTSQTRSSSLLVSAGVPDAPTSVSASATSASTATVTWTAPSFVGESAITSYTVTGSGTVVVSGTSATVTGLSANTSYTFSVLASNAVGAGAVVSASMTTNDYSAATGGTEATVTNYNGTGQTWKTHTFASNANFVVSRGSDLFTVLSVGGGGKGRAGTCGSGGPSCWGTGGGGGGYTQVSTLIAAGTWAAVIGGGGTGYGNPSGGSTTFIGQTFTGGGSGTGTSSSSGGSPNGYPSSGSGFTTTISGSSQVVSRGAGTPGAAQGGYGGGGNGAQRTGGDYPDGSGYNGYAGVVIVAYRTA